jgi:starch synthase
MNIILIATEVEPLAKSGGLADVTSYLPREWEKQGHNTIIVMPKYSFIDFTYLNLQNTLLSIAVPMGFSIEYAGLWKCKLPYSNVDIFLIDHEEYFNRNGIYGDPTEFQDNDKRFTFLSRAVFEVAKAIDFTPDIIHAHDYHTALSLAFLKLFYQKEYRFSKTAGVFTIHNLAYQGKFNPYRVMDFTGIGMKEFYPGSWYENDGVVNFMKIGIMFADKITTVSPTYSNEIRMPYYSEGLQDFLNLRGNDLIGILNGVNYDEWNPEIDQYLNFKYYKNDFHSKYENKKSLLNENGIYNDLDIPLLGIVSRLTEQKGIDIIQKTLSNYIEYNKVRLVLLGSGDKYYTDFFYYLKDKFPNKVIIHIGYNTSFSHKIFASSDFMLIPSRFEPCGLTQMYALKYGTIPIVRHTGGLADTVFEYKPENSSGNGLVFNNYSSDDFEYALNRALSIYNHQPHWSKIRINAMNSNYSSYKSAENYIQIFQWALEKVL